MIACIDHGVNTPAARVEWTEIDEAAAREGAAALRLQRRTGARVECLGDQQREAAACRPTHNRTCYDRMAAITAFERLFRGEKPRRRAESTITNSDRQRRLRARRKLLALGIAA